MPYRKRLQSQYPNQSNQASNNVNKRKRRHIYHLSFGVHKLFKPSPFNQVFVISQIFERFEAFELVVNFTSLVIIDRLARETTVGNFLFFTSLAVERLAAAEGVAEEGAVVASVEKVAEEEGTKEGTEVARLMAAEEGTGEARFKTFFVGVSSEENAMKESAMGVRLTAETGRERTGVWGKTGDAVWQAGAVDGPIVRRRLGLGLGVAGRAGRAEVGAGPTPELVVEAETGAGTETVVEAGLNAGIET